MSELNLNLLLGSALVFVSVLGSVLSQRLGVPLLLVFLVVGMLAGEDGPGGVQFDDTETAFLVGNLALAVILLDGGLRTRLQSFRVALAPSLALATFGVLLTAVLLGAAAMWLLELDWRHGLLLGAVVASTDAAAVFASLKYGGVTLNERVEATLEIESGVNDPLAIFLVITLLEALSGAAGSPLAIAGRLLWQLAGGAAGGALLGLALALVLERSRMPEGLYALLILSGGVAAFAAINQAGASGFLGVYVLGLTVGNRRTHATEHVLRVMDGLAWLAQAGMFLLLGLLVTPSQMIEWAPVAIALALFLMLVARPVAVAATLAPFRFPQREVAYIAWVGLRGAVPIILAMFPLMAGLPAGELVFDIAFAVVLVSLLVQGSTITVAARLCGVEVPRPGEPIDRFELALEGPEPVELMQFDIADDAPIARRGLDAVDDEREVRCVAVERDGRLVLPGSTFRFANGDRVLVLAPSRREGALARLFNAPPARGPLSSREFFGEFTLRGDARAGELADAYGFTLAPDEAQATLEALVRRRLQRPPVIGDAVALDGLTLTVREMEGARVVRLGLKLRARRAPPSH